MPTDDLTLERRAELRRLVDRPAWRTGLLAVRDATRGEVSALLDAADEADRLRAANAELEVAFRHSLPGDQLDPRQLAAVRAALAKHKETT